MVGPILLKYLTYEGALEAKSHLDKLLENKVFLFNGNIDRVVQISLISCGPGFDLLIHGIDYQTSLSTFCIQNRISYNVDRYENIHETFEL